MSLVSHSHKFIYPSSGRCGTGSIHGTFRKMEGFSGYDPAKNNKNMWKKYDKHAPARVLKKLINNDKIWNSYFKFTFVRNTYSHVISSYFFWVKIGRSPKPLNGIMDMACFEEVVKYYKTPVGRRYDNMTNIRSQHSFICDEKGKNMMDFVGRFETLQSDFDSICKKINIPPIQLPIQNSSAASNKGKYGSKVHWKEHYRQNPEAQEFVYKHWKRDIDAFKFKLEL